MKKVREYSSKQLEKEILADARALGVAENWAKTIADKTVKDVEKWIKKRGAVTEADMRRVAHKKLQELHADVAYIFKNRDKIL